MGYRSKNKVYKLLWEEAHDLHGLEVTARALKMGELMKLGSLVESSRDKENGNSATDIIQMVKMFSGTVVGWNYEDDDGNPVKPDQDGIDQLEDWEFYGILDAYMSAAVPMTEDLGKGSTSGNSYQAEPPPMDEL